MAWLAWPLALVLTAALILWRAALGSRRSQ
jgi:hypothetical protein